MSADVLRVAQVVPGGPVIVHGPAHIELTDGTVVNSERFMVAICACKHSATYPLCDTSHRRTCRSSADTTEQ